MRRTWNDVDLHRRLAIHRDKQRQKVITSEKNKREISARLENDIAKFLANGGKIDHVGDNANNALRSLQIDHETTCH